MQSGKGGDVAAAFGGAGSQTAFGPRGAQKPLEKATIIAAAIFMFLALLFSLPGFGSGSVVGEGSPSATPPPASNPAVAPTPSASLEASPAASASPAESPKEGAAAPTKPSPEAKASPAASPAKK
ncbi:MAG: preprotein translocase subunit SecG [Candidatus Binatia bacterium]